MGGLPLSFSYKTTPFHPAGKSVFDCCAKEGSRMAIWQLKEKIKGDLKLQRPIQKTIHYSLKATYVLLQKKKEERAELGWGEGCHRHTTVHTHSGLAECFWVYNFYFVAAAAASLLLAFVHFISVLLLCSKFLPPSFLPSFLQPLLLDHPSTFPLFLLSL